MKALILWNRALRLPRYYARLCLSRRNAYILSYMKPALMWPPRSYGQRPHSEIRTCLILYNFTPFMWPLEPVSAIVNIVCTD